MKSDPIHHSSFRLHTFFSKFDQFADAPGAVAKMRELVRHLAVTGKLVAQNPSDELGELLLKKINSERLAAVKARQISPMKPLPAIGDEELLFELQRGWAPARLIELVMEIQTGPFGSSLHKSDYQLGGTPVINPASLKDGKIVAIDEMAIGHATLKRLEVFKLNAGDIVMARRGEMGRCAIVTKNEAGWLCGTGSLVLRMPLSLFAPYLAMLIGAPMARTYLGGASVGTTMQNLNQSILAKMPVGVPPLAEQKRIVAKVDELMGLCDRLEAQQQEREQKHAALARASLARFGDAPTPANLNFLFHSSFSIHPSDLRKSILTLAVQGKLVPQDPNDEPAEKTFPKLVAAGLESEEDGFPSHWLRPSLGKLGEWRGGGTPSKSRPEFWTGDLPWVSPKDMKVFHIADAQDHISPAAVEGSSVKLIPPGSLLMVVRGMILARAFPVALTMREVTINQDMKALLPSEPKAKEYLLVALRAFEPVVLAAIEHSSHGTCKLKTEFLQDFVIPLPPLAEQRRIVAKVNELMALVDELEAQLAASRAAGEKLLAALVAELTVGKESPAAA
jgi:type I restriction enzyme S subunit